ncbi:pyridoxamine 5'-phosphate oxidase, partial [Nodosilinea sp. LEGE 07298]|nr:pyridoxamine 5'-phosphate oxidase [Nodosilinea sp. LEGE 07298]
AQPRTPEADFSPQAIDATPPAEFCLVLLTPYQVDHLELRGDPQNRTLYTQPVDRPWQVETVNP